MILIKLIRKKKTSTDFITRKVVFYSFLYFPAKGKPLQKSSSFVLVQTGALYIYYYYYTESFFPTQYKLKQANIIKFTLSKKSFIKKTY